MEFLFLNHSAGVEALIVFLSLFFIILLSSTDMLGWIRRKIISLNPRKAYTLENSAESTEMNLPPPITLDEIESVEENSQEEIVPESDTIADILAEVHTEEISTPIDKEEIIPSEEPIPDTLSLPDTVSLADLTGDAGEEDATITQEDLILADTPLEENKSTPEEETHTPSDNEEIGKEEVAIPKSKKKSEKKKTSSPLPSDKRERLVEMVNNVKTLIARSHIDDARALIVNGLAIDKNHTELNLLMASLYEREHSFEKAEFILKDVAEKDPDNIEVLTRLATVLAMQRKYEIAYEMYKKILSLAGETEEVLYTLTHLASEMSNSSDVYTYAKAYLRQYPKNPEILWLYSQSQIAAGERKGAVETLIKLKNLTPYNQEIVDLIGKLVTEEELAGNFGGEK